MPALSGNCTGLSLLFEAQKKITAERLAHQFPVFKPLGTRPEDFLTRQGTSRLDILCLALFFTISVAI
jgi:hypothetical protein